MSDPELLPEGCEASADGDAPAPRPAYLDASRFHGDGAPAWHELPLSDDLLDRLRAAGY